MYYHKHYNFFVHITIDCCWFLTNISELKDGLYLYVEHIKICETINYPSISDVGSI